MLTAHGRAGLLGLWLTAAGACASAKPLHDPGPAGRFHVLRDGESLREIAAADGVPLEDLLEINGLRRAEDARPGQTVFLLDGRTPRAAQPPGEGTPNTSVAEAAPQGAPGAPGAAPPRAVGSARGAPAARRPVGTAYLRWPVAEPRLSSTFGVRQGRAHDGIDMAAPLGTPVYAARDGVVLYSGDGVKGYGNLVVLEHESGLLTVYGHNSVLLVKTGDRVKQAQEIARVGQSGRATAPHLHFEVRRGEAPQDPLRYLPPLR